MKGIEVDIENKVASLVDVPDGGAYLAAANAVFLNEQAIAFIKVMLAANPDFQSMDIEGFFQAIQDLDNDYELRNLV